MKAAIYARVSTSGQTVENQVRELKAVAAKSGWDVVQTFSDAGISGKNGRDKRPQLDALLKAVTRREVDIVLVWAVDRLGRSLQDLLSILQEIHGAGADLFIHQQAIDTTTPAGKALFGMLGVFAEFERSMIQERIHAGLNRARAAGKQLGRPGLEQGKADMIVGLREQGVSLRKIAAQVGVSLSTVQRVLAD